MRGGSRVKKSGGVGGTGKSKTKSIEDLIKEYNGIEGSTTEGSKDYNPKKAELWKKIKSAKGWDKGDDNAVGKPTNTPRVRPRRSNRWM